MRPRILLALLGIAAAVAVALVLRTSGARSPDSNPPGARGATVGESAGELDAAPSHDERSSAQRGVLAGIAATDAPARDAVPAAATPTARLRVFVARSESREPCPGATVSAKPVLSGRPEDSVTARTDTSGWAELEVPTTEGLEVVAFVQPMPANDVTSWNPDTMPAGLARISPLAPGATVEITIVLQAPRTISWHARLVDDETFVPVSGADVYVGGEMPVTTDAQGRFVFTVTFRTGIAPWSCWTQPAGYCALRFAPSNGHESVDKEEIVLARRSATVTGLVHDAEGRPRRGAAVRAIVPSGTKAPQNVHLPYNNAGEDGRFVLAGVPARVPITIDALPGAILEGLVLRNGETRDVMLRTELATELTGRVLDTAGAPVRGGRVTISLPGTTDTVRIRADGSYYIPFVYAGRGTLEAECTAGEADAPGWALEEIEIPSGQPEWKLDLRLKPLGRIAGRLVDAAGRAVPRGMVLVSRPGEKRMDSVTVGVDGTFSLDYVRGSEVLLCGSTADRRLRGPVVRATPGQIDVELRLPATGSIRGRIVDPAGLATNRPSVRLTRPGNDVLARSTLAFPPELDVDIDADGSFVSPSVPVGTWSVQGASDERRTRIATVVVREGEEALVPKLHLEECGSLRILAASSEAGATIEVRRGEDSWAMELLEQWGTKAVLVPVGDVVVIVRDPKRGEERHEVRVSARTETVLQVLRQP